ncbi:uncharacterized protein C1orf131 homolog isoform X2 [Prionailurus viverrinus]|uniref:uncharacterized protein C1orf131 homolog isoform X2 n=1 Tax=Prionailurus viverrinus TaxID=61388 RepID=UPI001FF1C9A0|nr:uncharacterized protein C1orf131 homolog isoform X2 [Prionailurus viverrinus]
MLLGAVLPRRAARPRLGRRHPLRPLFRTPGAAILTRTEAAPGPATHARARAQRVRTRKCGRPGGLWAARRWQTPRWPRSGDRRPPRLRVLRHFWMPCSGTSTTSTKTNILENDVDRQEFNLEKARLEVHRFGITGYGKGKERVLERERAIMLGAQPPKNSYVNYKVLQEQIKEKKAAKEEEKRMAQDTDIFKKKKRKGQEDRRAKKKKSAPSILSSGQIGQVGKFKNGTLILSQVDIKKINSSRVAK